MENDVAIKKNKGILYALRRHNQQGMWISKQKQKQQKNPPRFVTGGVACPYELKRAAQKHSPKPDHLKIGFQLPVTS